MLGAFPQKLVQSGQTAGVIISVALMLFLGFAMTRITKALRLPDVTAYILTGILIGPYCLNLIPASVISGMDFISDIALAFIAFSVGEFFKLSTKDRSQSEGKNQRRDRPPSHSRDQCAASQQSR